jgi:hypothetical protein
VKMTLPSIGENMSGAFSRPSSLPHRAFQSELRHRLAYPSLRPIRLGSLYGILGVLNFSLWLRAVNENGT